MENPQSLSLIRLTRVGPALALLALMTTGCVTTGFGPWGHPAKVELKPPTQIACTWKNNVAMIPDYANNGKPTAALVGRIYLFNSEDAPPIFWEGKITVLVWPEGCEDPKMVEATILNPDDLKRLGKPDVIGPGYTVAIPWHLYNPGITKILIRTAFEMGGNASPLFTQNAVTLAKENGVITERHTPISINRPGNPTVTPAPPMQTTRIPIR